MDKTEKDDLGTFLGPITLNAVVHLMSPEGHTAEVSIGLAPGRPVDAAAITRAIRQAAEAGAEHGMKPMGPATFFNHVLVKAKTGRVGQFATPDSMQYELDTGVIEYEPEEADDDEDEDDE